jgi:NADH:ubiquinone oxidoreductase subunit 2 (subunit N)
VALILLNIYIYIYLLLNLFIYLFVFDLKHIKSLIDLKKINNITFMHINVLLIFLSFAGIPPLMGFLSKFLIFIYIFYKNNILFFLIFLIANMFIIYFYLQNLKFLVSKSSSNLFLIKLNDI